MKNSWPQKEVNIFSRIFFCFHYPKLIDNAIENWEITRPISIPVSDKPALSRSSQWKWASKRKGVPTNGRFFGTANSTQSTGIISASLGSSPICKQSETPISLQPRSFSPRVGGLDTRSIADYIVRPEKDLKTPFLKSKSSSCMRALKAAYDANESIGLPRKASVSQAWNGEGSERDPHTGEARFRKPASTDQFSVDGESATPYMKMPLRADILTRLSLTPSETSLSSYSSSLSPSSGEELQSLHSCEEVNLFRKSIPKEDLQEKNQWKGGVVENIDEIL